VFLQIKITEHYTVPGNKELLNSLRAQGIDLQDAKDQQQPKT